MLVHRWGLNRVGIGFLMCALVATMPAWSAPDAHWVTAWSAPPDTLGPPLAGQTVRQIIRTSIGGSAIRIRLSNLLGTQPVTIGPVHVAVHASDSAIRAGTDQALTFGGRSTATIAPGGDILSDPAPFEVAPLEQLAVSFYLPTRTGPTTTHDTGIQTAFITLEGDFTAALALPTGEVSSARFFLTDVEVQGGADARSIVAFGDSITDGYLSTRDHDARWPDALAGRLQADPKLRAIAVANAGISGNRVLHEGDGPSALDRFERDALNKPNVHWILVLEGINDIGVAGAPPKPEDEVSAPQIIDGLKTLVGRAHARGIKIWGGTLTPFGGVDWPYHTAAGEIKRLAINKWIRTSGTFDAVIDFEQVIRDPSKPDRILPAFDSGDHLHPNDAGYKAMADSLDLRLFR